MNKLHIKGLENRLNITQLTSEPTRITQHTKSIIDWIYTDSPCILTSGTLNINISDHLPVFLVQKKGRNQIDKHSTTGRSYLRYNEGHFSQLLSQQNWAIFDASDDPDLMSQVFEHNISVALDSHCPVRTTLNQIG